MRMNMYENQRTRSMRMYMYDNQRTRCLHVCAGSGEVPVTLYSVSILAERNVVH